MSVDRIIFMYSVDNVSTKPSISDNVGICKSGTPNKMLIKSVRN